MNTDQERRVRAALRDLAEEVPVATPPAAAIPAPGQPPPARARAGWLTPVLAPLLAAAAVAVLVAGVGLVPGWLRSDPPPALFIPDDRAVLPEQVAGPSWRTASVADSPPGPVIAAFVPSDARPPLLLLVGVDGRTYRQLDSGTLYRLSNGRGGFHPIRPLLSPDGTRLAGDGGYTIDLTGVADDGWFPVVPGDTQHSWSHPPLLAWSPDSRWLAYQVRAGVALVDPHTGDRRILDIGWVEPPLAFSPDGQMFAVRLASGEDGEPQPVAVFNLAGDRLRELDVPPSHHLVGQGTGWSPDGALLVTYGPGPAGDGFGFVDATGSGVEVPAPVPWPVKSELLGWRSPRSMVVWQDADDGQPTRIVEIPIDGGEQRVISRLADDPQHPAATLQLASGLLAEAEIRDPGPPRRGPLPATRLATLALVAGAVALLFVLVGRRLWRRVTRYGVTAAAQAGVRHR